MSSPPLRPVALAAAAGGACWLAFGAQAAGSPNTERAKVDLSGVGDYLGWGLFALCLALSVAGVLALHLHHRGADGRLGRAGALVAMAGAGGQCVVISTIVVTGEEPTWFNAAAPAAIFTWLIGSIVLAVAIRRARILPVWVAVALPVATLFAIIGSDYGTSVLIGALQLVTGLRILRASDATAPGRRPVASANVGA